MRIDVDKLAANGFRLDLSEGGPTRLVELGPSGALNGYYESTREELRIRAGASHALLLTNLDWALEPARITLTSNARLEGAQVGLIIARDGSGWGGTIGVRSAAAETLELSLSRAREPLSIGGVELEGVELERTEGELSLRVRRAGIERVAVDLGFARVAALGVELPEGLAYDGSGLRLGKIEVRELTVDVGDVAALRQGDKPAKAGPPIDLTLLDQLNGKLDVDLNVDATVPVIGRRRATHHFRIPINEGSIDFKGVERNLSFLEDAVIDFSVRDGKLCLDRDLPLVPFDRKTLVHWELAPEELLMAKRNRVRLRRLRDFQVAKPPDSSDRKPGVAVSSLHFDNVALDLALRGPAALPLAGGRVRLGSAAAEGVGSLRVRGDVRYDASGAADRTSLRIDAERIAGALERMTFGALAVDVDVLALAALEGVTLTLEGLTPRTLDGTLRGVEVSGLRLRW